jgi:hypothetical protein
LADSGISQGPDAAGDVSPKLITGNVILRWLVRRGFLDTYPESGTGG